MAYYKVTTYKLKSLGLRRNPNIMQFGKYWVIEPHPTYDNKDNGGIWVTNSLSNARKLKKYYEERYGMARIFECQIGDILYQNSYRTKTDKVKLAKEILVN